MVPWASNLVGIAAVLAVLLGGGSVAADTGTKEGPKLGGSKSAYNPNVPVASSKGGAGEWPLPATTSQIKTIKTEGGGDSPDVKSKHRSISADDSTYNPEPGTVVGDRTFHDAEYWRRLIEGASNKAPTGAGNDAPTLAPTGETLPPHGEYSFNMHDGQVEEQTDYGKEDGGDSSSGVVVTDAKRSKSSSKRSVAELKDLACHGMTLELWPTPTEKLVENDKCRPIPAELNITRYIFVTSFPKGLKVGHSLSSPLAADCICQGAFVASELSKVLPDTTRFGALLGNSRVSVAQRYHRSAPLRWILDDTDFVSPCGSLPDTVDAKDVDGNPVPPETVVWTGAVRNTSNPLGYNLTVGATCFDWSTKKKDMLGAVGVLGDASPLSWLSGGLRSCSAMDVQLLCAQVDAVPTALSKKGCPPPTETQPLLLWGPTLKPLLTFEEINSCNLTTVDDARDTDDSVLDSVGQVRFIIPVLDNDDPAPLCNDYSIESQCIGSDTWELVDWLTVTSANTSNVACTVIHVIDEEDQLEAVRSAFVDRRFRVVLPSEEDIDKGGIDLRCPSVMFSLDTCPPGFAFAPPEADLPCQDIDECLVDALSIASSRCVDGVCRNTFGSFRCEQKVTTCSPGFEPVYDRETGLLSSCAYTNFCLDAANNECGTSQTCTSTIPSEGDGRSYRCECPAGTVETSQGNCADVNECGVAPSVCPPISSTCVNTLGSYYCKCNEGYVANRFGTCDDVNECADDESYCGDNAVCTNTVGSAECRCDNGFEHENSTHCIDINECLQPQNACRSDEVCNNTLGSFECVGLPPERSSFTILPAEQAGTCQQRVRVENAAQASYSVAIADTARTAAVPSLAANTCPSGSRADRPAVVHVLQRPSLASGWETAQVLHLGSKPIDGSTKSCDIEHVLGSSLTFASDGNTLAAGTQERPPGDDSSALTPGYGIVFDRVSEDQQFSPPQMLEPKSTSPAIFGDAYGSVVCMSADALSVAVGAPYTNNDDGRLVVFHRASRGILFTQLQDLGQDLVECSGDTFGGSLFGYGCSFSADGTALIVAAPQLYAPAFGDMGVAVVLRREDPAAEFGVGPEDVQYLTPPYSGTAYVQPKPLVGSLRGVSVDIDASGTTAVLGRPGDRQGRYGGFAIYHALENEWIRQSVGPVLRYGSAFEQTGQFDEQYPDPSSGFGEKVRINAAGTVVYVSAPEQRHSSLGLTTGSIFVYSQSVGRTWSFVEEIKPIDPSPPFQTSALAVAQGQGYGHALDVGGESGLLVFGCNSCREAFILDAHCRCGLRGLQAGGGGACATPDFTSCDPIRTYGLSAQLDATNVEDSVFSTRTFYGDDASAFLQASDDGSLIAVGLGGQNRALTPQVGMVAFYKRGQNDVLEPGGVLHPPPNYDFAYAAFGSSLKLSGDGKVLVVFQQNPESKLAYISGDSNEFEVVQIRYIHFFYRTGVGLDDMAFTLGNTYELNETDRLGGDFFQNPWLNVKHIDLAKDGSRVFVGNPNWRDPETNLDSISAYDDPEGRVMIFQRDGDVWGFDDEILGMRGRLAGLREDNCTWKDEWVCEETFRRELKPDVLGSAVAVNADGDRIVVYCTGWLIGAGYIRLFDKHSTSGEWEERVPENTVSNTPFRVPNEREKEPGYTKTTGSLMDDDIGYHLAMSDDGMTFAAVGNMDTSGFGRDKNLLVMWEQDEDEPNSHWLGQVTATISLLPYEQPSDNIEDLNDIDAVSLSGDGNTVAVAFGRRIVGGVIKNIRNVVVIRRSSSAAVRWHSPLIGPFNFLPFDNVLRQARYGSSVSLVGSGDRVLFASLKGTILNEVDINCACGADCECREECGVGRVLFSRATVDTCSGSSSTSNLDCNCTELATLATSNLATAGVCVDCVAQCAWDPTSEEGIPDAHSCTLADGVQLDTPDVDSLIDCTCDPDYTADDATGICKRCTDHCTTERDRFIRGRIVTDCSVALLGVVRRVDECFCDDETVGVIVDSASGKCMDCIETCAYRRDDRRGVLSCASPILNRDRFGEPILGLECICDTDQGFQHDDLAKLCVNCDESCSITLADAGGVLGCSVFLDDLTLTRSIECDCGLDPATNQTLQRDIDTGMCVNCKKYCLRDGEENVQALDSCKITGDYDDYGVDCTCDDESGFLDPSGLCLDCEAECATGFTDRAGVLGCSIDNSTLAPFPVACVCAPQFVVDASSGKCLNCEKACTPSYLPLEDRASTCHSVVDPFGKDKTMCECRPGFQKNGGIGGACYDCGEFSLTGNKEDVKSCDISECTSEFDLNCASWVCSDDAQADFATGLCYSAAACTDRCGPAPGSNKTSTLAGCYARTRADALKTDANSGARALFGWSLGCQCLVDAEEAEQHLKDVYTEEERGGFFTNRLRAIGHIAYRPERRCFDGDERDLDVTAADFGCDPSTQVAVRRASHLGSGDYEYLCVDRTDDTSLCSLQFDGTGVLYGTTLLNKIGNEYSAALALFVAFSDVAFDCVNGLLGDLLDPLEHPKCRLCICGVGYESKIVGGRTVCVQENFCGPLCVAATSSNEANQLWQALPAMIVNTETKETRPGNLYSGSGDSWYKSLFFTSGISAIHGEVQGQRERNEYNIYPRHNGRLPLMPTYSSLSLSDLCGRYQYNISGQLYTYSRAEYAYNLPIVENGGFPATSETLIAAQRELYKHYASVIADPANYNCGPPAEEICDPDTLQFPTTLRRTSPLDPEIFPWLAGRDPATLRQGCGGADTVFSYDPYVLVASPGTSYSEYPIRQITGSSPFADGSFCADDSEGFANVILSDDSGMNIPPPPSSACPCIDEGARNPVIEVLDIGSPNGTRFYPATKQFDDEEEFLGIEGPLIRRWHQLDALPIPFHVKARVGAGDSQRCIDCEVECSAFGDGEGVLACAPRADTQLSPGGASLIQCYCADGYHADATSGRCVSCIKMCTLDGNGLSSLKACSLTPPDPTDGVSQPRCHCATGYAAEPTTGICISVAEMNALTELSSCQEFCLHSEFVDPAGVTGCGVGIVEGISGPTLNITRCRCNTEEGYRLDGESRRCNSPFTVQNAIDLFKAAADNGLDPFQPLRTLQEFKSKPLTFLAREARKNGKSLAELLPFDLSLFQRRRRADESNEAQTVWLQELQEFEAQLPASILSQLNASSLSTFVDRVVEADNDAVFGNPVDLALSNTLDDVDVAVRLLRDYDTFVSTPGPVQRRAQFLSPITFGDECKAECGMLPGVPLGGLFCMQARIKGDIVRKCVCYPGFTNQIVVTSWYDAVAILFAANLVTGLDIGSSRCTPCVGAPENYLDAVGGSLEDVALTVATGCTRSKPSQIWKTTCWALRVPSIENFEDQDANVVVTNCACVLRTEYYEYQEKPNSNNIISKIPGSNQIRARVEGGCYSCKKECSADGSGDGVFQCDLTALSKLEILAKLWRKDVKRIYDCQCKSGFSPRKVSEDDLYEKCGPAKCPIDFLDIVKKAVHGGKLVGCRVEKTNVLSTSQAELPATIFRSAFNYLRTIIVTISRKLRFSDRVRVFLYFTGTHEGNNYDCGPDTPGTPDLDDPNSGLRLEVSSESTDPRFLRDKNVAAVVYPTAGDDPDESTADCEDYSEPNRYEKVEVENRRDCAKQLNDSIKYIAESEEIDFECTEF